MSFAFRNQIDITVLLSDAAIADVVIRPRSRPPLTRLFAGKPADSLLPVLPRLFSLCSVAHQTAFQSAVEAARRQQAAPATVRLRERAVAAERLTELLRGLFVERPPPDRAGAFAMRGVMQAGAVLAGISEGVTQASWHEAGRQMNAALGLLGITDDGAIAPDSAISACVANCQDDAVSAMPEVEQSFLVAADDREVVTRLLASGATYSDAPELRSRNPETGVWARKMLRESGPPLRGRSVARLKARIAEIVRLSAWLERDDGDLDDGPIASYQLGAGRGAAAVECARGRLYHAVVLDNEDRIVGFEFLAPTEWNFHVRGPLVRSLTGSRLAPGQRGQDAVRAWVGSFDPCVGFNLSFREAGHA